MKEDKIYLNDEGLTYIPEFIRQESDKVWGDVVTHEEYNQILNVLVSQGDYNTNVLHTMTTEANPARAYHIPYLDESISQHTQEVLEIIAEVNTRVVDNTRRLDEVDEDIAGVHEHMTQVNAHLDRVDKHLTDSDNERVGIIDGTVKVGHAKVADTIEGADTTGVHKYFGTDWDGLAGFHELMPEIYLSDIEAGAIEAPSLEILPKPGSITETYLSPEVIAKLNGLQGMLDYGQITYDTLPKINNVVVTGDLTLTELGVQPAGNYLTEIPADYPTNTQVDSKINTALSAYSTTEVNDGKYADIKDIPRLDGRIDNSNSAINTAQNRADAAYDQALAATKRANQAYSNADSNPRIYIQTYAPQDAKRGDLWVIP